MLLQDCFSVTLSCSCLMLSDITIPIIIYKWTQTECSKSVQKSVQLWNSGVLAGHYVVSLQLFFSTYSLFPLSWEQMKSSVNLHGKRPSFSNAVLYYSSSISSMPNTERLMEGKGSLFPFDLPQVGSLPQRVFDILQADVSEEAFHDKPWWAEL